MGAQPRRIDLLDLVATERPAAPRAEAAKLHVAPIALPTPPRAPFPPQTASTSLPSVSTRRIHAIEGETIRLAIGGQIVAATVDTGAAGLVVRAIDAVETYAEKIISRAEGVHKIDGRILQLN